MMVILLDGGNWNEINVLTSNFILLGDQLLDEIPYRHAIYFYKIRYYYLSPSHKTVFRQDRTPPWKGCQNPDETS